MRVGRRAAFAVVFALAGIGVPAGASGAGASRGWVVDRVRFEPLGGPLGVAGLGDFKGTIDIAAAGGAVQVVNELGLEDYVKGISEVPVGWPAEAQKAQAVAARTYALWQKARTPAGSFADICATQSCQVYAGLAKEQRPGANAWTSAVDATAGQVLLWRGAPIMAKYSSTSGGRSVAGSAPYLRSVEDRDDAVSPYHRWAVTLPFPTLASIFAPPGELEAVTRVGDSVVFDWMAPDTSMGQLVVPAADFRTRVNSAVPAPAGLPLALPSVRFALTSDGGSALADGRGWGHGIGMSQYGALGKALRGMRAPDILAAYYAGLRPVVAPPQQLPSTMRVLLDQGRAKAGIGAAGPFRVVDGAGNVIAVAATGAWEVVAAGGRRLRVVPPAGQDTGPGLGGVRLERAVTRPGETARLHFQLASLAAVQVTVQLPTVAPIAMDLGIRTPGDQVLDVPASAAPGPAHVVVRADAGGGRTTVVPLAFEVTRPAAPAPMRVAAVEGLLPGRPAGWWLRATALMLLLAATAGLVASRRQLH